MSSLIGGDDPEPEAEKGKKPLSEAQLRQRQEAGRKGGRGRRRDGALRPDESDLRSRLREPIERIADFFAERDPELCAVLTEDGPKIAKLLAKVAASPRSPGFLVSLIRGLAAALEPVDAFGRLLRLTFTRWRRRRAERRAAEPEQPPEPPRWTDDELPLPHPPAGSTPERFRADNEPPPTD